jgi:serine/threonine protein kinase/Flp pilus assembly protein TadD
VAGQEAFHASTFLKKTRPTWNDLATNYALEIAPECSETTNMPETLSEEAVFHAALAFESADQQAAYLAEACANQPELRRRVDALLRRYVEAHGPLDRPVSRLFAASPVRVTECPGTVIGPYKLMEQIGEGGMGLVFVAEQQQPIRRKVALKLIKPGMDSKQVIARFEVERQALAMMDHPNIAKILDGGTTPGGRPYFVMELVKGLPITDYCDKSRLDTRQRLELFLDVCHAIQHAHQKGIIHRDLKPSNILVEVHDVRPVVKIIDFGISKAIGQQLTEKTLYTGLVHMVGTPMYMSPEQAGLSSLDVDTRSDVYSLGVLLYELLTGTTPFESETLKKAGYDGMRRIIREEEPPKPSTRLSTLQEAALSTIAEKRGIEPRRLAVEFRGELDWVVMKALDKDRNRRYETTSAFAADIHRYLSDEPVQAFPPSSGYRLRKFARRHRARLGVAAILGLAILLGGAALWRQELRSAATAQAVENDLKEADIFRDQQQWSQARQALERAKGRLEGSGLAALQDQVERRRRELDLVARLEDAHLRAPPFSLPGHQEDKHEADRLYGAVFAELGLKVGPADVEESARIIQHSAIRTQLVTALDYWAFVKDGLPGGNGETLRTIAGLVDNNSWRKELRDPQVAKDYQALQGLAEKEDVLTQPPATLLLLCYRLDYAPHPDRATMAKTLKQSEQLLRQAQLRYPTDFWINFALAQQLALAKRSTEAIGFWRAALVLQPHNARVYHRLGITLWSDKKLAEAAEVIQRAIQLKPADAEFYFNLGGIFRDLRQLPQAEAAFRNGIALQADNAEAYHDLADILEGQNKFVDAEAAARKAIELRPKYASAFNNLGSALRGQGKLADAIKAFRQAIDLNPQFAEAYNNLGIALEARGEFPEAVVAYQKAIELNPDNVIPHINIGVNLGRQNKFAEAEAAFRKAIKLRPDSASAYDNLGVALLNQGKLAEAEKAYRKAIELEPDFANAHFNLGVTLRDRGQFAAAVASLKRAEELHSPIPGLPFKVRQAEQFVALDAKLPKILKGEIEPADIAERLALARFCGLPCRRFNVAATRFYSETFAAEPRHADDLDAQHRYAAACVAALAGCGQGNDAAALVATERARLRAQALAWLRADLAARRSLLEKEPDKRGAVRESMRHWQQDDDFDGVRGAEALAKLPEAERQEWQKLWQEIGELERGAAPSQPR